MAFQSPVQFASTAKFSRSVDVCLDAVELLALELLLGRYPKIGTELPEAEGARGLDFSGTIVYYLYEPRFRTICLLDIEKVDNYSGHGGTFPGRSNPIT
jgi:hypothetical protein